MVDPRFAELRACLLYTSTGYSSERDVQAHQGYVEAISKLDSTYKKDLLPNICLLYTSRCV